MTSALPFETSEGFAQDLDDRDSLGEFRQEFNFPLGPHHKPWNYLVGNSLGLMPKRARAAVIQELDDWAMLGVEAHFQGHSPWYSYHEMFRESAARLVGGRPSEVVLMNSLTVNLHLMLASFYQPVKSRSIIAI
ncbi:MAG: kynureninase, partial [Gemmatimonadota bacterium]